MCLLPDLNKPFCTRRKDSAGKKQRLVDMIHNKKDACLCHLCPDSSQI